MSLTFRGPLIALLLTIGFVSSLSVASERSEKHQAYAKSLWKFVQDQGYQQWTVSEEAFPLSVGSKHSANCVTYLNRTAAANPDGSAYGSVAVVEHLDSDGQDPTCISLFYRVREGYHPESSDWYWAHLLPDGTVVRTVADRNVYDKPGFTTYVADGRLWVFRSSSTELADYLKGDELAKHVIRPGAGPEGMTVKAPDTETVLEYLLSTDRFVAIVEDGRLWVFRAGSEELGEFLAQGELAEHVIRPGAGPEGMTVKAPNVETIEQYLEARSL